MKKNPVGWGVPNPKKDQNPEGSSEKEINLLKDSGGGRIHKGGGGVAACISMSSRQRLRGKLTANSLSFCMSVGGRGAVSNVNVRALGLFPKEEQPMAGRCLSNNWGVEGRRSKTMPAHPEN